MKIVFILGHELPFPPSKGGGVNSLLHSLTKAMVKVDGITSVAVYSPLFDGLPETEIRDGVIHRRLKGAIRRGNAVSNLISGMPYAIRVRNALDCCDILNSHNLYTFLYTSFNQAKVVTHTIHREPKKYLMLYREADRIYTGSESVTQQTARLVPSLSNKLLTIHNCVDYEGYDTKLKPIGKFFRFMFVGRFAEDKGLRSLIEGFLKAATVNPRIHLTTIGPQTSEGGGEPNFFREMNELVQSSPHSARVDFCAPVFDNRKLEQEVRNVDCICLPSLGGETLNMGVLEALRLAKPILVSDLAANKPLVDKNYGNGLVIKAGDVKGWAEAILAMGQKNSEEIYMMGKKSYVLGRERFSSGIVASQYVDDYRMLLRNKGYES